MDHVNLIAGILEDVLGLAGSVTSGQAQNVISILERAIPVAVNTTTSLLQPIQNIIVALSGSGALTAAQVAALQAQSDAIDEALDAAAQADDLT